MKNICFILKGIATIRSFKQKVERKNMNEIKSSKCGSLVSKKKYFAV
jgi:hypothetical protein